MICCDWWTKRVGQLFRGLADPESSGQDILHDAFILIPSPKVFQTRLQPVKSSHSATDLLDVSHLPCAVDCLQDATLFSTLWKFPALLVKLILRHWHLYQQRVFLRIQPSEQVLDILRIHGGAASSRGAAGLPDVHENT